MTVRLRRPAGVDPAATEFLRAVAGDPAAFRAFLGRFEGRIARIVRSLVPRAEREDVFQEVCLRLVAKGRLYDPARPLAPWLDAVTRRVCAAAGRRRSRERARPGIESEPEVAAPEDAFESDPWIRDAVRGYVERLPFAERETLRLVYESGLSQREAAARIGVPHGTVATWCARAVRALREKLREGDRPSS